MEEEEEVEEKEELHGNKTTMTVMFLSRTVANIIYEILSEKGGGQEAKGERGGKGEGRVEKEKEKGKG